MLAESGRCGLALVGESGPIVDLARAVRPNCNEDDVSWLSADDGSDRLRYGSRGRDFGYDDQLRFANQAISGDAWAVKHPANKGSQSARAACDPREPGTRQKPGQKLGERCVAQSFLVKRKRLDWGRAGRRRCWIRHSQTCNHRFDGERS